MELERKTENPIIPSYSLTGDLISFLRCGLQYRYHNRSSLPPSRPVQLWFGEFIHGVMENAYRIWKSDSPPFPWPSNPTPYRGEPPENRKPHDIGTIGEMVERTLRAGGKNPRSKETWESAYKRAEQAVNYLGQDLFPLIKFAEERVMGTRDVPSIPADLSGPIRAKKYELHGVIDVVTNVSLTEVPHTNVIRQAIQKECPGLTGDFEVIIDYKGTERPTTDHAYWKQGEWQVNTYAWLRTNQGDSLPVVAGVLLYINELAPSDRELVELKKAIRDQKTDIVPKPRSQDESLLNMWKRGDCIPDFSLDYRLARAIRVIPINPKSSEEAAEHFDKVVMDIEGCVNEEIVVGNILNQWDASGDRDTCVACDFRYICPSPAPRDAKENHEYRVPTAP